MKKALPIILVLAAVIAAVVVFLRKQPSELDLAPGQASELAPGDTIVFIEAPDLARTAQRWKGTSLYDISQEPEWKEFTKNWGTFSAENEILKEAFGVLGEIQKADPAGVFLAMTAFDSTSVKLVGGFPYRGKKSDVDLVVRKLKEQIAKGWPGLKSEASQYEGIEVETLKANAFTASIAYHENWFFFATDTDLLLQTLGRHLKKPGATAALSANALWKSSQDKAAGESDFRMWAKWDVLEEKMKSLSAAMGAAPMPAIQQSNPMLAISYNWKLDGKLMRDRVYMHTKEAVKLSPQANRSLAFTRPATFGYVGWDFSIYEQYGKESLQALEAAGIASVLNETLKPKGLTVDDVLKSFGPELAVMSAWEAGAITLPDLLAVVEVKDQGKAKSFAELIAAEMGSGQDMETRTEGDTTFWTIKTGLGVIKPTLAINGKHLMFGLSEAALKEGMKQLSTSAPNLATVEGSAFPAAVKTVTAPAGMLMYVDMKVLFERLYDKVKPMLAFALVEDESVQKHFDPAKLPQATTISKHLQPMVISMGVGEQGWLMESTGSLSLINAYVTVLPSALIGFRAAPVPMPAPAQGTSVPPTPGATPAPGQ